MRFEQWRERKWSGPCASPATNAEHAQYANYLQRESGLKPFQEMIDAP